MTDGSGTYRFVDLFCGAGGASCGAWQAGFDLLAGVDQNQQALETHAHNLPGEHIEHDLSVVRPSILPPLRVDWVHGSPPCQGFSQAKGERDPDDIRNQLVFQFIEWVEAIQPKVATMENVTGMTSISTDFMGKIRNAFEDAGYRMKWRVLNAADYGVPQTRQRIICVAVREDLPTPERWFPKPTHAETPTQTLDGRRLKPWKTVRESIGDLADDITEGMRLTSQQNEAHQEAGRRPYHSVEEPARTVRCGTPPKLVTDGAGVENHVPQEHRDSTRERFATLQWGGTGNGMSNRRLHPERPSPTICASPGAAVPPVHYQGPVPDHDPVDHSDGARKTMAQMAQGFCGESVTDRRLHPEQPSGTITVSSRTPPVHYQTDDIRRLTVREAARLQSFNDWFVFKGTKTSQLEQVGNAVPPRLQQHIAATVRDILEVSVHGD